jgi:hypothetical protein
MSRFLEIGDDRSLVKTTAQLCGLAAITALAGASAKEFPLEFKTLNAKEAMSLPGGYGVYGTILRASPRRLQKEPRALCRRPVYGQLGDVSGNEGMLFRLEESKGDRQGYDRLILDVNNNGDLTDDPIVKLAEDARPGSEPSRMERLLFGPVEVKVAQLPSDCRALYYAEATFYNRELSDWGERDGVFMGRVRLRPGWLLQTTVEVDGLKQKVALVDGNSSLRLGDPPEWRTFDSGGEPSWYAGPADSFLRDRNGSGKFGDDRTGEEAESLAPVHYFGPAPYTISLGPDCKTLRVEPYREPVAELTVGPHGETVSRITLAWEQSPGQWYLLSPVVAGGKVKVPAGNYRLYTCQLDAKASDGQPLQLTAYKRTIKPSLKAEAGAPGELRCGAPLEVKVTAERDGADKLNINAVTVGAGGETYVRYAKGKDLDQEPAKPVFTIQDANGKEVASGNLAFG